MHHRSPPDIARRSPLSTGEAAAFVGCHRSTISRAIERGELEAVRLGRTGDHRIAPEALRAWLRPARDPEERTE
jgi:excisionase family DNA binding protein